MSKIMFSRKNKIYPEFSNYHLSPFIYNGIQWGSVEAAFQAQKVLDREVQEEFSCMMPGVAKREGRRVLLRPDWEQVKYDLMYEICLAKFSQNEYLKSLLLSTGDNLLVEDTTGWHDNIWGCCTCSKCANRISENRLGVVLMRVRGTLRGEPAIGKAHYGEFIINFNFGSKDYIELTNSVDGRRALSNIYKYAA